MKKKHFLLFFITLYFAGLYYLPKYISFNFPEKTILYDKKTGDKIAEGLFTSDENSFYDSTKAIYAKSGVRSEIYIDGTRNSTLKDYLFPFWAIAIPLILVFISLFFPFKSEN